MDVLTTETFAVWANNYGESGYIDHPITEAMPATSIKEVRATVEMVNWVGSISIQAMVEWSWDGVTWTNAAAFGPINSLGEIRPPDAPGYAFAALVPHGPFCRFGIRAVNSEESDVALNLAYATLRLEFRSY